MGEAAPKESTMEDILASIRKIISSEDTKARAGSSSAPTGQKVAKEQTPIMSPKTWSPASVASEKPQTPVRDQSAVGEALSPAPGNSGNQGSLANLAASLASKGDVDRTAQTPMKPVSAGSANRSAEPNVSTPSGSFAALAQKVKTGEVTPTPIVKPVESAVAKVEAPAIEKSEPSETATTVEPVPATVETKPTSLSDIQKKVEVVRPADHVLTVAADEKEETPPLVSSSKKQDEEAQVSAFKEALVSPSTQKSVTGSMDRLKKSVADLDSAQVEGILRPMLKEWLDNNLPGMVEKMVQSEIDRIANTQD